MWKGNGKVSFFVSGGGVWPGRGSDWDVTFLGMKPYLGECTSPSVYPVPPLSLGSMHCTMYTSNISRWHRASPFLLTLSSFGGRSLVDTKYTFLPFCPLPPFPLFHTRSVRLYGAGMAAQTSSISRWRREQGCERRKIFID
jgi:hypothetical protein